MTPQIGTANPSDPEHHLSREGHVWERWERIWTLAFYGMLVLCLGLAASDAWTGPEVGAVPGGWPGIAILTGTSLALGLWYHLMIGRRRDCIGLVRAVTYLTGAAAIFVALTWLHPAFLFLPFVLFVQLFSLLPIRWAAVGAAPLTLIVWWRGASTDGGSLELSLTAVLIILGSLAVTIAVGLFIESIIRQSVERQRLIEELRATRDDLAVAERRVGVEAERQRLAGDIHDTLAQGFTSIVLHLEAADAAIATASSNAATVPPALIHHLDQARQTARDSLGEARRLVWALRPAPLESASLPAALGRVAERWQASTGVPVRFSVTGPPPPLHPDVEVTLLRITQEALANVRKHAQAERVAITLSFGEETALLDIRDDGAGFAPDVFARARSEAGGFGLHGMRERVEALGGSFVVESAPGQGTTIAVAVPAGIGPRPATGLAVPASRAGDLE